MEVPGITLVNLDFADQPESPSWVGLRSHELLRTDSRLVSGCDGPRKPVIPELLNELHCLAETQKQEYFGLCNADIRVTAAAVERIKMSGAESLAFSRTDCDSPASNRGDVCQYGIDLLVIKTAIWPGMRNRIRPYILGESLWDNVLCAIFASHSKFEHETTEGLILHESHPVAWGQSPFGRFVWWLSVLDGAYFSRWCCYVAERESEQSSTTIHLHSRGESRAVDLLSKPWGFQRRLYFAARACYYHLRFRQDFQRPRFF